MNYGLVRTDNDRGSDGDSGNILEWPHICGLCVE